MLGKSNINLKHSDLYTLAKSTYVINKQSEHRLFCATSLHINGTKKSIKISDVIASLIKNGVVKTESEALGMIQG